MKEFSFLGGLFLYIAFVIYW